MSIDLITAHLARPLTHRVITTYASGAVKTHDTRSKAQADNYATGERRKIGRDLFSLTGEPVCVVSVTVERLPR